MTKQSMQKALDALENHSGNYKLSYGESLAQDNVIAELRTALDATIAPNSGHGHVRPRPDGVRTRCGGVGICNECSKEAAKYIKEPK